MCSSHSASINNLTRKKSKSIFDPALLVLLLLFLRTAAHGPRRSCYATLRFCLFHLPPTSSSSSRPHPPPPPPRTRPHTSIYTHTLAHTPQKPRSKAPHHLHLPLRKVLGALAGLLPPVPHSRPNRRRRRRSCRRSRPLDEGLDGGGPGGQGVGVVVLLVLPDDGNAVPLHVVPSGGPGEADEGGEAKDGVAVLGEPVRRALVGGVAGAEGGGRGALKEAFLPRPPRDDAVAGDLVVGWGRGVVGGLEGEEGEGRPRRVRLGRPLTTTQLSNGSID